MNTYTLTEQELRQVIHALNEATADAADDMDQNGQTRNPRITRASYNKLHAAHIMLVKLEMKTISE